MLIFILYTLDFTHRHNGTRFLLSVLGRKAETNKKIFFINLKSPAEKRAPENEAAADR